MQRRDFLKLTVLSAASVSLGLTGCGGDGDSAASDLALSEGAAYFPHGVASGDPRANSMILWTKVKAGSGDWPVRVQVAKDSAFTHGVADAALSAQAAHDHCLRVKITGLEPGQFYYYRFIYVVGSNGYWSRTGRCKTAPAADADVAARFAVLSCQDYIGRYYNSLKLLLAQTPEPDFIAYVGDYIYETTGDPEFQRSGATRAVKFSQPGEAIALGSDGQTYFAAQSLSNYRDIYQTYRTDAALQDLHARFPIVAIWDDHEFSDDCYGATATYHDGKRSEEQKERRLNAEQVFFEYMPVDDEHSRDVHNFFPERAALYPNTKLYRDLRFGRHLHLLLTDYRSFRPDHLIPEDAFPGRVVMDKAALMQVFEAQAPGQGAALYESRKAAFGAYVDLLSPAWNKYLTGLTLILTQAYTSAGATDAPSVKAYSDLSGKISVLVFNQLATQYNQALQAGLVSGQAMPLIDAATESTLERGLAYMHFGKQSFFTAYGARYGVVKASFDLYAGYRYLMDMMQGKTPENVFGDAQQKWLETQISLSNATFIGLGSSVSTASLILDFTQQTGLPAEFRTAFYLNADHWDGFPNRRKQLLELLKRRGNTFIFAGDIHAAFVCDHSGVVDFTGPAVSSETFQNFVAQALNVVGASFSAEQQQGLATQLVPNLDAVLQSAFSPLKFAATGKHGFILLHVDGQQVTADYHLLDSALVNQEVTPQAITSTKHRFVLAKGGQLTPA